MARKLLENLRGNHDMIQSQLTIITNEQRVQLYRYKANKYNNKDINNKIQGIYSLNQNINKKSHQQ